MIRKLLGIHPTPAEDGAYSPSPLALKLATSQHTDYDDTSFADTYPGKLKIMMLCTEQKNLEMANGKHFSTGNHPVEMLVPMLHFQKAGFETDIYTPTGASVKIEMWAMPGKDERVKRIYAAHQKQFEQPKSLKDLVQKHDDPLAHYIAVFIPGGHGALLGLPESRDVQSLLQRVHDKNLLLLSICHGPAALLAAGIGKEKSGFMYRGYKIAAFPDSVDAKTPLIGYMPGKLKWKFGHKLNELGVEIINSKADKSCFQDRNLVTGASPDAANNFGKLAAQALLDKAKTIQ